MTKYWWSCAMITVALGGVTWGLWKDSTCDRCTPTPTVVPTSPSSDVESTPRPPEPMNGTGEEESELIEVIDLSRVYEYEAESPQVDLEPTPPVAEEEPWREMPYIVDEPLPGPRNSVSVGFGLPGGLRVETSGDIGERSWGVQDVIREGCTHFWEWAGDQISNPEKPCEHCPYTGEEGHHPATHQTDE